MAAASAGARRCRPRPCGGGGRGHHGGGVLQEAATAAAGVEGERLVLPPRPAADNGGEILGMA